MNLQEVLSNNSEANRLANNLKIIFRNETNFKETAYSRVFNSRRPNRIPNAIIKVQKEQDIVDSVQLANLLDLRVSVISGGHSWAAWGVRSDALMIDLGDYQEIEYNNESNTVSATPSVHGRMLNSYLLKEKRRFFPGGHCPDVGIGGFLLQGGMGWCCRGWGWACQKIKSLNAVTSDGLLIKCSESENSDLFWLARGCGPGFPGIVTKFELETVAEKTMLASDYFYEIKHFKEVMNWVLTISPTTDKDVETVCVTSIPDDRDEPIAMVHIVVFKDNREECLRELQKFEEKKVPGAFREVFGKETTLIQEYDAQAAANPDNHRYRTDNVYLRPDIDVAKVLEQPFTTIPNRKTFCLYFSMDPLTKLKDMALSMQSEHYIAIYSVSDDEKEDDKVSSWMSRSFHNLEKYSPGAYLGDSDFQTRKTRFWSIENHRKLNFLKQKFDPNKRFCGYLKDPVNEKKNNELSIEEVYHERAVL